MRGTPPQFDAMPTPGKSSRETLSRQAGTALALALAFSTGGASAQVHRCLQPDGSVVLSDRACPLAPGARTPDPASRAPAPGDDRAAANRRAVIDALEADLQRKQALIATQRAQQAAHQARQDREAQQLRAASTSATAEPFAVCTAAAARVALQSATAGQRFRVISSTPDLQITRICTVEGSVLISCSRADAIRTTQLSPRRPGDGCG